MEYIWSYKTNPNFTDMKMTSDGEYLTGLWFVHSFDDDDKHQGDYKEEKLPIFEETIKWLDIYFSGKEPDFTPKYKINNSTGFRNLVIEEMLKIPFGKTVTYEDIAKNIAKKKGIEKMSSQAVGGAVGWNPICLIVPCHRVVGKNGSLTGYGGGIKNKYHLLELEGLDMRDFTVPKKGTKL